MTATDTPELRASLGESGRALWDAIVVRYALDPHEERVLFEACRIGDLIDDCEAQRGGALTIAAKEGERVHPLLVEARLQRVTQARLVAALRLPSDEQQPRTQRRSLRGVHAVRGGA
jgi:hypothetical protein